jgi:serine/threonine protein kinase
VFGEFSPSEVDSGIKGKKSIGEGAYGTVYKAYIRDTTVAVKILKHEGLKAHKDLTNEVSTNN